MDSEDGRGSNSSNSTENKNAKANEVDVFGLPSSLSDSEDEWGNNSYPRWDLETTLSRVSPCKKLRSSSPGSPSPDASLEDFIQVDLKVFSNSKSSDTASPDDVQTLPTYDKSDAPSDTSQVSDLTHESLSRSVSLTESPLIQMMERHSGFEPNRISPFVFSSRSPSPIEWSVASNESLFSIHIGNNSFNRDHAVMLKGDIHKSGELYKSEELHNIGGLYKSSEVFSSSPTVAAIQGMESDKNNVNYQHPLGLAKDHTEEKLSPRELSCNQQVDASGTSIQSISFQEKKKNTSSSCYSSDCSCDLCCATWSSCCSCKRPRYKCPRSFSNWPCFHCFKWSSCSCSKWHSCCWHSYSCSWACCFGCNSKQKRIFCCSSEMLTEVEPMQRHSKP